MIDRMTSTMTAPNHTAERREVDQDVFRNVVGNFASGVTVITTANEGELFGTTASAVSSLSADPPMMLICLNRSSSTHDAIVNAKQYAINILADDQDQLARHFSRKGSDKFGGIGYALSDEGLPLLDGALATIVCEVQETATGGTHTIFLGRVLDAQASTGEPLAYFRGSFGRLERTKVLLAYDGVREWVLGRRTPLGVPIDSIAIADELRIDVGLVNNSLIRLSAESLVTNDGSGCLIVTPMTAGLVDSFYDGRQAIEVGVVEGYLDRLTDEGLASLVELKDSIAQIQFDSAVALDVFLRLNVDFHAQLVGLAGSTQLTESYLRLNVGTVWRETFNAEEWGAQRDKGFLDSLITALKRGDKEAFKAALRAQTTFMKSLAKDAIARHGGTV